MASTVKKGGNRRLNQMNGDHLSQLKDPIRSEMNRTVIGTNKGCIATMNKRLDLYYKDKNIALEKIRRRQDAVYGTMLRVQREKKLLQKAMYKKRQEETRQMHSLHPDHVNHVDIVTIKHDHTNKRKTHTDSQVGDAQVKDKEDRISNINQGTPSDHEHGERNGGSTVMQNNINVAIKRERTLERKTKVLEVRKKAPLAPLVRERSDLAIVSNNDAAAPTQDTSLSRFPNIRTEILPPRKNSIKEPSVTDMVIDSVASAQTHVDDFPMDINGDMLKNTEAFPKTHHVSRRMSKSTVMPTISEKDSNRDLPTRHSDELVHTKEKRRRSKCMTTTRSKVTSEALFTNDVISSAFEEDNTETYDTNTSDIHTMSCQQKHISLVDRNKHRVRQHLRNQQLIMKNEPVNIYLKDSKGNYVRSNAEFKRREFNPPSMKEKHFQEKMLRAQVDARMDQRKKLEDFFERMAQEERERQRIRDAFQRQAQEERDEARRKMKEDEEKIGFSAAQMVTLFSKGVVPEGVDPSSFEAIKYCKYIRTYSPNSMAEARQRAARDGKLSSWDAIAKTLTQNQNFGR